MTLEQQQVIYDLLHEMQCTDYAELERLAIRAYNKALDDALSEGYFSTMYDDVNYKPIRAVDEDDIENLKIK